ncbi:MAG: type IX secretion system sortase PorU [Cyclobacteriaceae bacterium]
MIRALFSICLLIFGGFSWAQSPSSSVLSNGDWYKLAITEEGIYKIDLAFLESIGLQTDQIDPQRLSIYGNGGGMLPQSNSVSRSTDLIENAIFVSGESDGRFDQNDYLLFYAEGPDILDYDLAVGAFEYQNNLYSDTTFYFLTVGPSAGKRIMRQESLGPGFAQIRQFTDAKVYENDIDNILSSGREWYGEKFIGSETKNFVFNNIDGLHADGELLLLSSVMAQSNAQASFSLTLNGIEIGTQEPSTISSATYAEKGKNKIDTFRISASQLNANNNIYDVALTFIPGGSGNSDGYLNFLLLQIERELKLNGKQTIFRSPRSLEQPQSTYILGNASNDLTIWDITNPESIAEQQYDLNGGEARFGALSTGLREFLAFSGNDFPSPSFSGLVANQNLQSDLTPEMVVISYPGFRSEAERLATFRSQHDGLNVKVVSPSEIYNEFSSGAQDVTAIRDYLKYLFDHGGEKLRYVLMFGRCSYDYKGYTSNNTNFVPTYQSRSSLHPIFSHSSDDYFGFLDADEGEWDEDLSGSGGHLLDIAVGRLPVRTREEAKVVVDKLINYSTNQNALGSWRQDIYYVADDGDFNLHQRDADLLADLVDTAAVTYNVKKIFLDAFPQEKTANGESAKAVNQAIDEAINQGALIVNYTGHGSEFRWAEETILSNNMIQNWENFDQLPLFVTATCEFGRHDDPQRISGAEILITQPRGGAIGLVTTARPVFASKNFILNKAFYQAAFKPVNGEQPRLGDIFQSTKNDSYDIVANRNFALLGDPSMKLAYPQHQLKIHSIENAQGDPIDTLTALSLVTINGAVHDEQGNKLNAYNGIANVTVFDQESELQTLGTESGGIFNYQERKNVIFRGKSAIENGSFKASFVVPKNISYRLNNGKISLYAQSNHNLEDAGGANAEVLIGGSNKNAPSDNTPPTIALFIDDTSFVTGGSTGSNPILLAKLSDENGINISNVGLGQDISATLDGETTFILNDFYQASLGDYTTGWVTYPIGNLDKGTYRLNLKAWDIYNNSNNASVDFIVADNDKIALQRVLNLPNPVDRQTQFIIDHNRPGDRLEVTIAIYDDQGKLVDTLQLTYNNSPASLKGMFWDGTDGRGSRLEAGMYIYKVQVRSLTDGDKKQEYQKLVLIN